VLPQDQEREIELALRSDALLAVVTVMSSPYVAWQQRVGWPLASIHGPLAQPDTFDGGLHAIVLVGRKADRFSALDSYFPAHDAFDIDDDAVATFFAGHAYIAEP